MKSVEKSEYVLYGNSDHDFSDVSPERMEILNRKLKKRVQAVRLRVAKKIAGKSKKEIDSGLES